MVVEKLPLSEIDKYECIKGVLLREFHITPRELRARFMTTGKRGMIHTHYFVRDYYCLCNI